MSKIHTVFALAAFSHVVPFKTVFPNQYLQTAFDHFFRLHKENLPVLGLQRAACTKYLRLLKYPSFNPLV